MTEEKHKPTIPVEEVAHRPLPGMATPGNFIFSPDDDLITYLFSPELSLVRQLYVYDIQNDEHRLLLTPPKGGVREEDVSIEEALRRERMRQLELGITQYAWSKSTGRLLLPLRGEIYILDRPGDELRKLSTTDGKPATDPRFSPDGEWVSFVQEVEVFVVPVAGGESRQLTYGARETGKTNGLAEFVAQEEMNRRRGYWWSPDSQWLAFVEVDERHIPIYRIMHQGKHHTGEGAQEDHRYPFAGMENARVRLGVVSLDGGDPIWMDLGSDEDIYLARVAWFPDGRLCAQLENRQQTKLDLVVFEPSTGERSTLLSESSDVWINLHDMFKPLKSPQQGRESCFIWASERSGFQHLYLYDSHGALIRQLTEGDWVVDELVGIDEERSLVYFIAAQHDVRERHLYVVSLSGGEPRRITYQPGTHTGALDNARKSFVDIHHTLEMPPKVTLRSVEDGSLITTLYDQQDSRVARLALHPPELIKLRNRRADSLFGAIYHPPKSFGNGPHPTLVYVYGGPHAQLVINGWDMTVNMRLQYLTEHGFLIFVLDNRGSSRRGLAFEGVIKYDMGHYEVEDQVDGVRWLINRGLTDPDRVGVFGWSYGGYMSLMCLAQAPDIFRCAVSGAPVTHLDGYDTHYTERYMGHPETNPAGYESSSVLAHVDGIQGPLMLIHGLIDENVHFRHTARLINALIAARIPYELLLFPDERHSPRRLEDRVYMEEQVRDFFLKNLGPF